VPCPPRWPSSWSPWCRPRAGWLTREELLRLLWPDTVVEEGKLTSHISLLRKGPWRGSEGAGLHRDLAKRGYRFVASVKRSEIQAPGSRVDRAMLVVLPFENLAAGERYDYSGRTDRGDRSTELARLSRSASEVIARPPRCSSSRLRKHRADRQRPWCVSFLKAPCARVGERVRSGPAHPGQR